MLANRQHIRHPLKNQMQPVTATQVDSKDPKMPAKVNMASIIWSNIGCSVYHPKNGISHLQTYLSTF